MTQLQPSAPACCSSTTTSGTSMYTIPHTSYKIILTKHYCYNRIRDALERFYRLVIPAFEDRTPITPSTFLYTLAYVLPLTFLAFLARRPHTRTIRILLVPSVICITLHSCLGYKWTGRGMHVYNWGEGELLYM